MKEPETVGSQSSEYPAESAVCWKMLSPHFDAMTHDDEQV